MNQVQISELFAGQVYCDMFSTLSIARFYNQTLFESLAFQIILLQYNNIDVT